MPFLRTAAAAVALALAPLGALAATGPSPIQQDLASQELKAAVADPQVRALYEANGWRLLWTPQLAQALDQALQAGRRHAIDTRKFQHAWDPAEPAFARDVALSTVALNYARALGQGVVDPNKLHGIFTLPREQADTVGAVSQGLASGDFRASFDRLSPQDEAYTALSRAYLHALQDAAGGPGPKVPEGSLLKPGMHDARVPQLIAALRAQGAAVQATPADPTLYDEALVAAVKALQSNNGLAVDGVVGPKTLTALNAGAKLRARKLAINLERLRWDARPARPTRIDVNVAAAELEYYVDGRLAWRTRVITGAPGHETPLLGASFSRLVVNPPWYVPASIAQSEILPRGQAYLRAHDMYVDNGRVIQRAGPQAALGQVKFDLDDPYAIYLHDTPAKTLFQRDDRHLSHGCVRVEDAIAFARRLAADAGEGQAFDAALASGETSTISLPRQIPVRLLYRTAYLGENGEVRFAPDAYGWDEDLGEALGLGAHLKPTAHVAALLGP